MTKHRETKQEKKDKRKKAIEENNILKEMRQPFKFIYTLVKYRQEEIAWGLVFVLSTIIVVAVIYIISFNITIIHGEITYKPQNLKDVVEVLKK